jgi:glycerol uptake facilitator-like aquaporin
MEVELGKRFKAQLLIREFIGTAALLCAINVSGGNPFAIAGTIFSAIVILAGPLNGGHFNPAVTFGVFVREFAQEGSKAG